MLFVVVGLCCAVKGYGKNGLGRHSEPPQLAGSENRLRATLSAIDLQRIAIAAGDFALRKSTIRFRSKHSMTGSDHLDTTI
jgi:hypothetical protein